MDPVRPELLAELRTFAQDPNALFMLVKSPYGRVPIWAEDVVKTSNDDELFDLVLRCVAQYIGTEDP